MLEIICDEIAEEESMEQKFREATQRCLAKREQPMEAITAGGLAAMAQARHDRERRQRWVTELAIQIMCYMASYEGDAAIEMLRVSGERIPFGPAERGADASIFSLSGEGVCEKVSHGGPDSLGQHMPCKTLTAEFCERMARTVLTDQETPTQVFQRFRARIMALAERL